MAGVTLINHIRVTWCFVVVNHQEGPSLGSVSVRVPAETYAFSKLDDGRRKVYLQMYYYKAVDLGAGSFHC